MPNHMRWRIFKLTNPRFWNRLIRAMHNAELISTFWSYIADNILAQKCRNFCHGLFTLEKMCAYFQKRKGKTSPLFPQKLTVLGKNKSMTLIFLTNRRNANFEKFFRVRGRNMPNNLSLENKFHRPHPSGHIGNIVEISTIPNIR